MGIRADVRNRAVFLDRDGVIGRPILRARKPHAPQSLAQLELLPGVHAALDALRARGFRLVVVTNQPDVARGTTPRVVVDAMNEWLQSVLPLDAIFTCYHDDEDRCACRKPLPGLITRAAAQLGIHRAASYLVGDRWRDIAAGRRAGCKTLFVDHGYAERLPEAYDFRVGSLRDAARLILQTDTLS
jgi:D-glycero-D-manno-heptose 1,7-bisphosphate phosphatase